MACGEWRDPARIIEERQQDATNYPVRKAMTTDESKQIEEILAAWYAWQRGYKPALGFGRVDPACRGFDGSGRYDAIEDRTAVAERKAKNRQAEHVQLCVDALHWKHRAALSSHFAGVVCQINAHDWNEEVGVAVFRNPREIDLSAAGRTLYQEAKFALLPALRARGMIKAEIPA